MGVIAEFVSDRVELLPGTSAAMTLRLFNGGGECREVSLVVSGPLSDCVRFEAVVVVLDPDQVVQIGVYPGRPVGPCPLSLDPGPVHAHQYRSGVAFYSPYATATNFTSCEITSSAVTPSAPAS